MLRNSAPLLTRKLLPALALLLLLGLSALADTVYVTSYNGAGNQNCPPEFTKNPLGLSGVTISGSCGSSANGTTAIASPPGVPVRPKATYCSAGTANWSIQTATPMANAGAVYTIEVAHTAASASADVLVTAYSTDGNVSAACTNSTVFNAAHGGNTWQLMGYITNNVGVTQPTITFVMSGGAALSTTSRLYIDCFKMTTVDPCIDVAAVAVNGPLVANQTTVSVSGVVAGATEVDVYADAVQIGSATSTGFAAGTVAVTTSALAGGQSVTAKQIRGSCVGGLSSAKTVGSGANPTLQVALELGKSNSLTGPIGAPAGGSGFAYWDHANGRRTFSFGSAPTGGYVITPSTNWVTLTFNSDSDTTAANTYDWQNNVAPYNNTDNYGVFEGLALAIDDTSPNIGPYKIYIDSIYNGTNLIQGFEGKANNTYGVMFLRPSSSGTTAAWLTSPPDTNYVNNTGGVNADTGTNSLAVEWVFNDTSINNWVRLYSGGSGTPYPQVDLHQPITVRMLVLPVGQTVGRKFDGNVSFMTNSSAGFYTGGSNTLGVSVTGTGTYTYQWGFNGSDIPGATDPSYTLQPFSGITSADAGLYTVAVTDEGGGAIVRSLNARVGDPIPSITNQPPISIIVQQGSPLTINVGVDGHVANGYPLSYQWLKNGAFLITQTDQQLSIGSASIADVGSYSVFASNSYGAVTSSIAYVDVVGPSIVVGTGDGLRGDYYTLHTNNAPFTGNPTLSRVDSTVDFNFGSGSPAASISVDYFTTRWYGQIQALDADTYTIGTFADDGTRLWVNGQLLVNNWILQGGAFKTGTITLAANQKYDLVMEYFENGVTAQAQLWWSNSTTVAWEPVPMSQMYSKASFTAPTATLSPANGSSFNGTFSLTATVVTNAAAEITSVQFFTNGVLLASAPTVPPYTYTWSSPPAGTYNISAQVQYDKSTLVNSVTNAVTVQSLAPVTSFGIAPAGGGNLTVSYSGGAGSKFVLLQTNNLAAPLNTWTRLQTNNSSPGTFNITPGADPAEFYRIKSE